MTDGAPSAAPDYRFGHVTLSLGLLVPEQLQEAVDTQEELRAAGIHTQLGDVMQDLELLTAGQCAQVLDEQDRRLREAGLRGGGPAPPSYGWLVAALVPALSAMPPTAVLAWAGALLLGAGLARGRVLRWLAVGWIAGSAAPAATPAAVAGSGTLIDRWHGLAVAVLLGVALGLAPLPGPLRGAGPLLLLAAGGLALVRRI